MLLRAASEAGSLELSISALLFQLGLSHRWATFFSAEFRRGWSCGSRNDFSYDLAHTRSISVPTLARLDSLSPINQNWGNPFRFAWGIGEEGDLAFFWVE